MYVFLCNSLKESTVCNQWEVRIINFIVDTMTCQLGSAVKNLYPSEEKIREVAKAEK